MVVSGRLSLYQGLNPQGEFLCKVNPRLFRWLLQATLSALMFVIETVCAVYIHSTVVEADGMMHLYDAIVVLVTMSSKLIGYKRTTRNTFGWVRVEAMGELVASVFVLSLSCGLFPHVVNMFFVGEHIENLDVMFYVILMSLLVKISGLLLTYEMHYKHMVVDATWLEVQSRSQTRTIPLSTYYTPVSTTHQKSPVGHSSNCEIDVQQQHSVKVSLSKGLLHLQAHFCNSVFAFVVLLLLYEGTRSGPGINIPKNSWLHALEQSAGILITIINCARVCPTVYKISMMFMQGTPCKININDLQRSLQSIHDVTDVHELHVWQLKGKQLMGFLHVRMKHVSHFQNISKEIRCLMKGLNINACTIQPEIEDSKTTASKGIGQCLLDCPEEKSCRDRQCCGGKVDPYVDIALFRRRSESIGRVEHHLLKHLPHRVGSPGTNFHSPPPVLRKLKNGCSSLKTCSHGNVIENKHCGECPENYLGNKYNSETEDFDKDDQILSSSRKEDENSQRNQKHPIAHEPNVRTSTVPVEVEMTSIEHFSSFGRGDTRLVDKTLNQNSSRTTKRNTVSFEPIEVSSLRPARSRSREPYCTTFEEGERLSAVYETDNEGYGPNLTTFCSLSDNENEYSE